MGIPVFHENLYGTAVVALAALLNALDLAGKRLEAVRVVICGAGTVGLGCARLLAALGLPAENLLLYDVQGLVHPERDDLSTTSGPSRVRGPPTLAEGLARGRRLPGGGRGRRRRPAHDPLHGPFPGRPRHGHAGSGDRLRGGAGGAPRRDGRHQQRPGSQRDRSTCSASPTSSAAPSTCRPPASAQGMMLAAARALADLAREEVTEEVSRAYGNATLHLRSRVPAPQAHRPAHPGQGIPRGGRRRRWPRGWRGSRSTWRATRAPSRSAWEPAAR